MELHYSVVPMPENGTLEAALEFRYFLILEGSGECSAQHQHFSLKLHDVLALPQNLALSVKTESTILAGCIQVSDMLTPRVNLYHLPGEHTGLLRQLFYMALDIQHVELPYYDTVRNAMHQLVFSSLVAAELAADKLNPTVVRVAQQINDGFTDPTFDLQGIVEQTGYSVNHFRKLFKDETGLPPLEFLNNRRLEYAKELFRQWKDRLSVAEIAHACGFRDEYYFSRYFKKKEGKTPGQYLAEITSF